MTSVYSLFEPFLLGVAPKTWPLNPASRGFPSRFSSRGRGFSFVIHFKVICVVVLGEVDPCRRLGSVLQSLRPSCSAEFSPWAKHTDPRFSSVPLLCGWREGRTGGGCLAPLSTFHCVLWDATGPPLSPYLNHSWGWRHLNHRQPLSLLSETPGFCPSFI